MSAPTSKIEWTDATWNPSTGCTQVSPGCDNCYAMQLVNTRQVHNSRSPRFGHPFDEVMLHANRLNQPKSWKTARRIFVNSMSDLFHRDIPDAFIDRVFDVMEEANHHTYQVLTKRADRMKRYVNSRYATTPCPDHIWLGVSVERQAYAWRTAMLRQANASVRWISAEPLLGSLANHDLDGIAWVVAGGESGPGARPVEADWIREIRDKCITAKVAFFFKQWGGSANKKRGGDEAVIDGRRWTGYPA